MFGVPEIKLDLEAQTVKLDDLVIGLFQVCAEQNNMRLGGRGEIGLDDNHHIQREIKLFVDELTLINLCAQIIFGRGFFQVLVRQGAHIDFVTLLRLGAALLVFTFERQIQGCIRTHFRNQVQARFANHVSAW